MLIRIRVLPRATHRYLTHRPTTLVACLPRFVPLSTVCSTLLVPDNVGESRTVPAVNALVVIFRVFWREIFSGKWRRRGLVRLGGERNIPWEAAILGGG